MVLNLFIYFLYTYNSTNFIAATIFFRLCRRLRLICSRSLKFDACDVINEKKKRRRKEIKSIGKQMMN